MGDSAMPKNMRLIVNGKEQSLETEADRLLLDVLREDLHLTGTKFGCGEGECGACTVLVEGKAVRSCITAVSEVDGRQVRTIEGLASEGKLHPLQQAFLTEQALQCGYCVPGQIMQAAGLLNQTPKPSRQEIVATMNGNLCRCCNYPNILAAVETACRANSRYE
jgi:aerobic-type carbon monoxide dehydrogenase small subunit (CoxS/CutS family)